MTQIQLTVKVIFKHSWRNIVKRVFTAMLFLSILPAFANCYQVATLLGYEVRCSDGNNYRVEQNSLTDQTIIKGTNPNTGSNWRHEYNGNESLFGPSSRHIDAQGRVTNCRYSELSKKTTCF
jgi:hypothetical protein